MFMEVISFLKGENIVLKCWDYIQGLSKTSVDIKLGPKKRTVWSNFEVNDPVKDSPAKRLLLPDFLPVKKIALKSIPDYLDTVGVGGPRNSVHIHPL